MKEHDMPSIITSIRIAARNRALYSTTLAELRSMTPATRRDLGINDTNITEVAHRAVYGK